MKISDKHIIVGLLIVLFAAWQFGYLPTFQGDGGEIPALKITPSAVTREAAAIQFSVQNAITDAAISATNTKLDVIKVNNGIIDFMDKVEQVNVNSASEQSTQTYSQGDCLILHLSSDSGNDYYDRWYYVESLVEGVEVRQFTPDLVSGSKSSGYYTYRWRTGVAGAKTGYKVQYTSGTTNYWGIGVIDVLPKPTSAQLDTYATLGTTTLSSVTDGSTWDTTAGSADKKMPTSDEDVYITLEADTTNVGFGGPMYTITNKGKIEERRAIVIFSTTMTAIDTTKLSNEGWSSVSDNTLTSEKAWYYIVPEQIPQKGDRFVLDIKLPVDSSGASSSTTYTFKVWVLDFQLENNVQIGSTSTTIPTAYGCIGEYGVDTIIHARAYTTSSGAGATQVLTWVLATP